MGSATSTGSVGGSSLTVHDAFFVTGTGGPPDLVLIGLSSAPGLCSALVKDANSSYRNTSTLYLVLEAAGPVGVGTYPAVPATKHPTPPAASVHFEVVNTACTSTMAEQMADTATSGSVDLTSVTSSSIQGSFDVVFVGGTLKGSFTAPLCSGVTVNDIFSPDAGKQMCL